MQITKSVMITRALMTVISFIIQRQKQKVSLLDPCDSEEYSSQVRFYAYRIAKVS